MPEIHISAGPDTEQRIRAGLAMGFYRQCSIGYHDECSDPDGCQCPCHDTNTLRMVQISDGVWVNPDNVLAIRERLPTNRGSHNGSTCEVIGGNTAFIVHDTGAVVVARLNRR